MSDKNPLKYFTADIKLSVIVPVYNEKNTILDIIDKINRDPIDKEIILVDDASNDGTKEIIEGIIQKNIKKVFHDKNQGKGAAIKSALGFIEGDIVIIQDADLEYHPDEYPQLIEQIVKGRADVVFGSRFIGAHRCFLFTHYVGNKIVNFMANVLFDTYLTDFMTCYKAFKADEFKKIELTSKRFGVEAEITGQVFRRALRVYEVPISYSGRNYNEGKKIRWTDFFVVIWTLLLTRVKRLSS
jgi:glycosyltransferase involved in cell wall biosynthesis